MQTQSVPAQPVTLEIDLATLLQEAIEATDRKKAEESKPLEFWKPKDIGKLNMMPPVAFNPDTVGEPWYFTRRAICYCGDPTCRVGPFREEY